MAPRPHRRYPLFSSYRLPCGDSPLSSNAFPLGGGGTPLRATAPVAPVDSAATRLVLARLSARREGEFVRYAVAAPNS